MNKAVLITENLQLNGTHQITLTVYKSINTGSIQKYWYLLDRIWRALANLDEIVNRTLFVTKNQGMMLISIIGRLWV